MKTTCLLGLSVLMCPAIWAADYHPLDVKTGLWETTMKSQMNGVPQLPPDLLNKLTPEQRAKMEAVLKAQAAQGPRTNTHRGCLTKEQLDKALDMLGDQQKGCARTLVTSTSSKQDIRFECTVGGLKENGTVHIEALSSESIKGTVLVASDRNSNNTMDFTSKWIGPACTEKDNK